MKRRFTALATFAAASVGGAALAAPPNESCERAIAARPGAATVGSTADASIEQPVTPCATADTFAAWYTFTAPANAQYSFTTDPRSELADTTIAVFEACDAGRPIACSDDTLLGLPGRADVFLATGQTVQIRVAGWGSTRGDFVFLADEFGAFARPPNDACEDAVLVTQADRAPGKTLFATGADLSSCGAEDTVDVWYAFVAPADGTYDFGLTQNSTAAHFVSVHDGCGGAELGCGHLGASAALTAGQGVRVRVGTNPRVGDQFNLVVGPPLPVVAPPNDTFPTASPVSSPSTTQGTTRGATEDALNFGPVCGAYVNDGIWYAFDAPAAGTYVFDTSASAMEDTIVAVFEGCDSNGANPPLLLGCDADSGKGQRARIDGYVEAGTSLCIAVAGNLLSEVGDVTLDVGPLPAPHENDHCEGAADIEIGEPVLLDNYASMPELPAGSCPTGDFALWYAFTAPEAGLYKFDTKASAETSPDIAIYSSCEPAEAPMACSLDPSPAVWVELAERQSVVVRLSTNVFLRGELAIRVGPEREDGVGGIGGGGGSAAGGAGGVAGSGVGGSGGSSSSAGAAPNGPGTAPDEGCSCLVAGHPAGLGAVWSGLVAALFTAVRRRSRRVVS